MIEGMIGRKVGMTQIFAEDGTVTPVTVIEAGPCVVVQRRTAEQGRLRGGAARPGRCQGRPSGPTSRMRGHHEKAGVPPTRVLREFRLAEGGRASRPAIPVLVDIFDGRGPGRRDRDLEGQGLPGRHAAPQLRAAAGRATARCSTARRARSAPRPSPRASSRACAAPGHMGERAGHGQEPARWSGSTRSGTCCWCAGRCPVPPGATVLDPQVARLRPAAERGRRRTTMAEIAVRELEERDVRTLELDDGGLRLPAEGAPDLRGRAAPTARPGARARTRPRTAPRSRAARRSCGSRSTPGAPAWATTARRCGGTAAPCTARSPRDYAWDFPRSACAATRSSRRWRRSCATAKLVCLERLRRSTRPRRKELERALRERAGRRRRRRCSCRSTRSGNLELAARNNPRLQGRARAGRERRRPAGPRHGGRLRAGAAAAERGAGAMKHASTTSSGSR